MKVDDQEGQVSIFIDFYWLLLVFLPLFQLPQETKWTRDLLCSWWKESNSKESFTPAFSITCIATITQHAIFRHAM